MVGNYNSDDEANFPHELLLTNKVFANHLSIDTKLSETQLSKIINREHFLVEF